MAQDFRSSADEQLLKIKREGEERDARRRAAAAGIDYFDVKTTPVQTESLSLIPEEEARKLKVAPFQFKGQNVALAVLDPEDVKTKNAVKELEKQNYRVKLFTASLSALEQIWGKYKFAVKKTDQLTGKVTIEKDRFQSLFKKLTTIEKTKKEITGFDFQTFSTGQLLEVVLAGALSGRASDIHFEAEEKGVRLRFRVDGLLYDVVPDLSQDIYRFILSRVKLLSNLKLNITDQPQDGRFSIALSDREIEMRVSIIPSEFGETIVMRILDPKTIQLDLNQLGLRKDDLTIVETELKKPNGMILNTGPTGSGKTTTLYAFLLHKRTPQIKIITIEDPVEYHLEDIEQTQVDPEAKYTFASGLRSIMRQDPDIILVGEVRDKETSEIAIQAALTGHLVFSTVHANSAAGAIPRLLDLRVKPASIGPALNLVIAQRLVRRLCEKCKVAEKTSADLQNKIEKMIAGLPRRVDRAPLKNIKIYKAKGCAQCGDIGYKGRVAIFELLEAGDEMEGLISADVKESAVQKQSLKQGMVTLQQDGILKVAAGITTFEEVEGATGPIQW